MKKNVFYFLLVLAIGISSCQKDDSLTQSEGNVKFGLTIKKLEKVKKTSSNIEDVAAALVTIENESGEMVYEMEKVQFYVYNDSYISEPLSLLTGNYKLKAFCLVDNADNVIYATPIESSAKAYLVENPLPIEFVIEKDKVNKVVPEVLPTENSTPEDFGYSTFSFTNVEIFDFLVAAFEYSEYTENFELTTADIIVKAGTDTIYEGELEAITNKITLNSDYADYNVIISKQGYASYNETFSKDSLQHYFTTPLIVIFTDIEDGLISYYPFNGNANDESVNSYDGIIHGATLTNDRNGEANKAYYFGGDDYIEIPNVGDIIPSEEITVSMWIQSEESRAQFQLMLCPDSDRFGVSVNYYHDGRNTNFWDFGWLGEGGNPPGRTYYRPEPFDTDWHHYVFVSSISQSKQAIYKDGELQISESDPRELLNAEGKTLKIGSNDGFGFHKGSIDEVRIYNRVLTDDEIEALYNE